MTSGPCLDGLSLALSQITCLVTDLSRKNFKSYVTELKSVSEMSSLFVEGLFIRQARPVLWPRLPRP